MASSKEYLDFILEQLSGLDGISCRPMMGEYIIYFRGKVVGGIYDDRFMVKAAEATAGLIKEPRYEPPYKGAKEMLVVEDPDDRELLRSLILGVYGELFDPGRR